MLEVALACKIVYYAANALILFFLLAVHMKHHLKTAHLN